MSKEEEKGLRSLDKDKGRKEAMGCRRKGAEEKKEKSVEQLTDERLTGVSGGIVSRQDGPCPPEQCAPPPPPPAREKCRPEPECAVVRAR